uniref:3-oxoacyl-[acyl-carrier-protein] reductase n=1 Tax=Ogataea wickerhamii TaxID=1249076 RepID=A0JC04_9ASCO|nr:(R)-2-octanol dehydrogenase [Ogataea wickerhamii]
MSYNFHNKVAVVTGALSGIGLSVAKKFLQLGAKVTISDVSGEKKYHETVVALKAQNLNTDNLHYVQADSSKEEDNKKLISETLATFGGLDIVCANAGIGKFAPTHETPFDVWKKVIAVNLNGVFLLDKLAINYWLEKSKPGVIVNMGSVHSFVAAPGLAHYGAAKGGVKLLTQTLALEYASHGIRVNSVNPGYISTPLIDEVPKERLDKLVSLHPIGRLGRPEEVADAVAFLCSQEATFINGVSLPVDGGYTAQ